MKDSGSLNQAGQVSITPPFPAGAASSGAKGAPLFGIALVPPDQMSKRWAKHRGSGLPRRYPATVREVEKVYWNYEYPPVEDYSPEYVPRLILRLEGLLPDALADVLARDKRHVRTGAGMADRHPLAVLVEHAERAPPMIAAGETGGYIPDLLALTNVVNTLEQFRSDPTFHEIVGHLRSAEGYRHDLLVLGMAGFLKRLGIYHVRLFSTARQDGPTVDFDFGPAHGQRLAVEAKAPALFDGPTRAVTREEAVEAIRSVWTRAVGGSDPQVPPGTPALLLTGGVTLQLESLPTIQSVAESWIQEHGHRHPNIAGISIMTFYSTAVIEPAVPGPSGPSRQVHGSVSSTFAYALNPAPDCPIKLHLGPPVPDRLRG